MNALYLPLAMLAGLLGLIALMIWRARDLMSLLVAFIRLREQQAVARTSAVQDAIKALKVSLESRNPPTLADAEPEAIKNRVADLLSSLDAQDGGRFQAMGGNHSKGPQISSRDFVPLRYGGLSPRCTSCHLWIGSNSRG
jgi:hypothetical protein